MFRNGLKSEILVSKSGVFPQKSWQAGKAEARDMPDHSALNFYSVELRTS
jgi:hypothetical protein